MKRPRAGKKVRHYSGETSDWFWQRVRKLPFKQGGDVVYALGCALQDLEGRVMASLESAEAIHRPVARRKEGAGDVA